MKLVIVESPYAGDVERNVVYARRAITDCLLRGEAPIASHLLFTQPGILDDDIPEQRRTGIAAGLAWFPRADEIAFYTDHGWSSGMRAALAEAKVRGVPYSIRSMYGQVPQFP